MIYDSASKFPLVDRWEDTAKAKGQRQVVEYMFAPLAYSY